LATGLGYVHHLVSCLLRDLEHISIVDHVGFNFGHCDGRVVKSVAVRVIHHNEVFTDPLSDSFLANLDGLESI